MTRLMVKLTGRNITNIISKNTSQIIEYIIAQVFMIDYSPINPVRDSALKGL